MADGLVMSHGQMVRKGVVGTSDFVRALNVRKGNRSYFDGSWEELEALVMKHFDNHEWGTGSKNGDVLVVNVPAEGFYTSIVEITDENRHLVEKMETVRREGEKPYSIRVIRQGMKKPPAKYARIVIYRADVLALDDDRSTDAEWEIVSVNAQNDAVVPMSPSTMLRNANNEAGGTLRTYTDQEWADAYAYWENHTCIYED